MAEVVQPHMRVPFVNLDSTLENADWPKRTNDIFTDEEMAAARRRLAAKGIKTGLTDEEIRAIRGHA